METEAIEKIIKAYSHDCYNPIPDERDVEVEAARAELAELKSMAKDSECLFQLASCQRRAIELVYGGKCDHMSGAEVRQMLIDEFGEETVAALARE